jgi:anaerobic selenocysteine-containing dehydrogenase
MVAECWNKSRITPLMKSNLTRRDFLATSTAIAAGLGFGLGAVPGYARQAEPVFKTKLHEALIVGKPAEDARPVTKSVIRAPI